MVIGAGIQIAGTRTRTSCSTFTTSGLGGATLRIGNLATLCDKCHRPENHQEGKFLWGWEPKVKSFRPETFMTTVRWRLTGKLKAQPIYGYLTNGKRIAMKLPKSHANDAFCIAGGTEGTRRCARIRIEQVHRNNRCLRTFYDARYVDRRTGQYASGQDLNCGRRTRNKNKDGENLRVYRGPKISKGRYQLRKKRYPSLYRGQDPAPKKKMAQSCG